LPQWLAARCPTSEAARLLHDVPAPLAASRLTIYMVGTTAGMVAGGFLASNAERCEYVVGFGVAALIALALGFAALSPFAVPPLFGAMGFCAGLFPRRQRISTGWGDLNDHGWKKFGDP
jgi:hypothetical protein